jgi:hypothetical protein
MEQKLLLLGANTDALASSFEMSVQSSSSSAPHLDRCNHDQGNGTQESSFEESHDANLWHNQAC